MTKSAKDTILNRLNRSKSRKESFNNLDRSAGFDVENLRAINYKLIPKGRERTQLCFLIKLDTGIVTSQLSQLTYQEVLNLIAFLNTKEKATARIKENSTEWTYDEEVEPPMNDNVFAGPTIGHQKNQPRRPTTRVVGLTLTLKDVIACKTEEEARTHIKTLLENATEDDFIIKVKDLTNEAVSNFMTNS